MKVAEVVRGQVGEQTRCDTRGPLTAEPFKLETLDFIYGGKLSSTWYWDF